jgi:thiol-disulfide isomerase/thioredoxin
MKPFLNVICTALLLISPLIQAAPLINDGPAPEFQGINQWFNSAPLTMASLRGKVILIDFWTYSCINCIHTLPHIKKWHEQYKDLVIIGVHTPEFPFEHSNLDTAIKRFAIRYPVAQDNQYATWNAYHNQYWPAAYLIDQKGTIVFKHIGEGGYTEVENAIEQLLAKTQVKQANP